MTTAVVEGRRIRIQGTVQGVGFRPWVYRIARLAGITGRVSNDSAGVTIDAFGDAVALGDFLDLLRGAPPPAARIVELEVADLPAEPVLDFVIVRSEASADRRVSIPPDLATCGACAAETRDPQNRRYRYAFTNCTNCGPRFTIATDIPYDREATTMAPFVMCESCRSEYEDVRDRRFHAQPNACPDCGPHLTLHTPGGARVDVDDPIAAAAEAVTRGSIVALKGIGGFHLACDATSAEAVARLRRRKMRDEKPFAVMARDIEMADRLALIGAEERRLLLSVERPIVLMPKRDGSPVAENVAPRNQFVGVFLPYSPLHHLLLEDAGRPLVMTSGNVSEEPMAFRNEDALARLGPIADALLLHDRDIQTPCDDSVATVIGGRAVIVRRSRGYVPRAVVSRRSVARPVLACGALLKNTFCLASGDRAWFGPHVGDLSNLETYESYVSSIDRLERFLQIRPEVIAYDMHPDYLSTHYALRRPERVKVPVQHHHAHVVSAMAEHGIDGPAIGIAYDGTGFGTDGTMWGGEIMLAEAASFARLATFRALPLVGGDRAIRDPWRAALALLLDAFGGEPPEQAWPWLAGAGTRDLAIVTDLLRRGIPAPMARGVGRYFDAFGALFLRRPRTSFEGQVALEWNQAADPDVTAVYPVEVHTDSSPHEIDLRPTMRQAVADALNGVAPSVIAAAFHNTLAAVTADVVKQAAPACRSLPVVATGGCFQNRRLAESVKAALAPEHDVRLHEHVPPGDGGVALGQAVIADAIVHRR